MEADKRKPGEAVCPGKKLTRAELEAARETLGKTDGPEYWRSLQELAQTPEFMEQLHREFPKGASEWLDPVSRRGFLKLMSASLALAGMTACVKQPLEPIVPYVRQPEELILGRPMYYATSMPFGGIGIPLLVESHEGRPTKIEGNPEHPACLGGSDLWSQASVLQLYDPDRSQEIIYSYPNDQIRPWGNFIGAVRAPLAVMKADSHGAGLRFLTDTVSSPTLAAQMQSLLKIFPEARWYQWEVHNRDNVRAGAMSAFGQDVEPHYDLTKADVIVSLDADFLYPSFAGFHRNAREWASRRRPSWFPTPTLGVSGVALQNSPAMTRLYAIESTPTNTGAKADHRIRAKASEIERYARVIATKLGLNAGGAEPQGEYNSNIIGGLVKDLLANRGRSVVIAGIEQPPAVHVLAHAINEALGNVGNTVFYTEPILPNPTDQLAGLKELVGELLAGKVEMLVIMNTNPVYDAPADLAFSYAMGKAPTRIHYGMYRDETAIHCHWHINGTQYLEQWSDARAANGMYGVVQPLIAPLYGAQSPHEFLNAFGDQPNMSGYETVQRYWASQYTGADFQGFWRKAVHDGFVAGSEAKPLTGLKLRASLAPAAQPATSAGQNTVELVFRTDPSVYDGRFANNAWLQEMAKPMTKIVWDNPVLISPQTARNLKLDDGDVIEIDNNGHKVEGAVWLQPGQPDDTITVFLGYGRLWAGRAGTGMGFSGYEVRTSDGPWIVPSVKVRNTGKQYKLITTQGFQSMEGREIVREATIDEYQKDPEFAHRHELAPQPGLTLYPNYEYTGYAWGMAIDQNACIGCNACVIACQSENNIPVVGKTECARGRYMHWIRVDTYYKGDPANPQAYFQPVPCMQCENAPCEYVCPVEATVHDTEGINDMVYNRCVGTRYCSNNCPYKVRRFNFFLFQDWNTPQYKMMRNPDVTVRSRGVMEKCTYCIQRIQHARIQSEEQNRLIRDYEVQPACMQACPADAIVFGNINDKDSRVTKLKSDTRNYGLLAELNTRPRTTYLAVVTNPNPELPVPDGKIEKTEG
jgi:molybdopterin-containing oxidoreductase family iron-sulfur binding subunit